MCKTNKNHCKSSVEGWNEIRDLILITATERAALEKGQICSICSELASQRCQRCGPFAFFCSECFTNAHEVTNIFHLAEKWEIKINVD